MRRFQVLLNGENFKFPYQDDLRIFGFYTTRTVNAASAEDAVARAIECVWSHPWIASSPQRNESNDPPLVRAEKVTELEPSEGPDEKIGLVLYLADQQ